MQFNKSTGLSSWLTSACAVMLVVGPGKAAPAATGQQSGVAQLKAGFSRANVRLQYSIAGSPMNTTHRLVLAKCLYNLRRGAVEFLSAVTGPEFSRIDYDWARETQTLLDIVTAEAKDLGQSEAFAGNEERFDQLKSVRRLLSEAALSQLTGQNHSPRSSAPPKTDETEGEQEEETFSVDDFRRYLEVLEETFVRSTKLDWRIMISTISIDGLHLSEFLVEQVSRLDRLGLRRAVDGLTSGLEEFWKIIEAAHSRHLAGLGKCQ